MTAEIVGVPADQVPLVFELHAAAHQLLVERLLSKDGRPSIQAWNRLIDAHDALVKENA